LEELVFPSETLPLLTASLLTESLSRSEEEEAGSGFCDLVFPPRLEKFHFPWQSPHHSAEPIFYIPDAT